MKKIMKGVGIALAALLFNSSAAKAAFPLAYYFTPNLSFTTTLLSGYLQAFFTSTAALQAWFVANTGPTIPLTKTYTGTYVVRYQSDADALVGTLVTGQVEVLAPANLVRVHDFGVVAPSTLGNSTHLILLQLVGGPTNITADHFKLDGNQQIGSQGIGGDTYALNVTLSLFEVTGTGDDGAKTFQNTAFNFAYIHNLRPWVTATDGVWNVNNNNTAQPHQDGIQAQRDTVISYSWVGSSNSPTATSSIIAIPAVGVNMSLTVRFSYLEGSANQPLQIYNYIETDPAGVGGPLISSLDFEYNLISPNYGKYPNSPYAIGLYQDVVTISNILTSDTRVPIAPPALATRPPASPYSSSNSGGVFLNIL